jgi:hypothetical protein
MKAVIHCSADKYGQEQGNAVNEKEKQDRVKGAQG